jgi:transposase
VSNRPLLVAPGAVAGRAKLNDLDPQAWLADVLARIGDPKITEFAALLPRNWGRAPPLDRAA